MRLSVYTHVAAFCISDESIKTLKWEDTKKICRWPAKAHETIEFANKKACTRGLKYDTRREQVYADAYLYYKHLLAVFFLAATHQFAQFNLCFVASSSTPV